jgi:hypothetical protein
MKQKKIEAHKIGLVGQAPSRRGDPRKPLAGPNGQKIARIAGMSYDELIACRRRHLNTHYMKKRGEADAFDHAKGKVNAADVLLDWRVERIVLLGKNVARCFGFRDLPFLAEIRIYGRRFLIFPHPSGTNRWWNERSNERRARRLLQRFLRGETGPTGFHKRGRIGLNPVRPLRVPSRRGSNAQSSTGRRVSKGNRRTTLKIATGLATNRPSRLRRGWAPPLYAVANHVLPGFSPR